MKSNKFLPTFANFSEIFLLYLTCKFLILTYTDEMWNICDKYTEIQDLTQVIGVVQKTTEPTIYVSEARKTLFFSYEKCHFLFPWNNAFMAEPC